MLLFSYKYKKTEDIDTIYWNELRVNFEKIHEQENNDELLIKLIKSLKDNEQIDLSKILKCSIECLVKTIIKFENKIYFLYIKEFQARKKRAINEIYNTISDNNYNSSEYIKLTDIFFSQPSKLFEVLVLHEWNLKGSGELFHCKTDNGNKILSNLVTNQNFHNNLSNSLYRSSGQSHNYRLVAHCELTKDRFIYLIFKQRNDTKRPGYDRAKRFQDIETILFSISLDQKIVEVKSRTKHEFKGIKTFLNDAIKIELTELKQDIYTKCNPEKITAVFKEGKAYSEEEPQDFIINKIIFSSSLLTKSPQLTIQLPNNDIWHSVVDAFKKEVVNLNSLRNISQIKFSSNNHTKTIRSVVLENGNIIFKLDDSNISTDVKNEISRHRDVSIDILTNTSILLMLKVF